jgi:aspartate carbamoyltransferase catalytic subunit
MSEMWIPSIREYAAWYQINGRRLSPHQVLMHPGPVNRGVELSGEVVDSPQAVITAQVEAGVVVRMAVLYELLAGAREPRAAPAAPPSDAAVGTSPDAAAGVPSPEPVGTGRLA